MFKSPPKPRRRPLQQSSQGGFTLIEILIAVSIAAILAAIALPSYAAYIVRAKVPTGLVALMSYQVRMEQLFQDSGNYGNGACAAPTSDTAEYAMSCELANNGRAFVATATGQGRLKGYAYSIDQDGTHRTVLHPKGVPSTACWSLKGGETCDA